MGYLHIDNLYKDTDITLFRECYALEKVHGTSAHVAWNMGNLRFFAGGSEHDTFMSLFDEEKLIELFCELGHDEVTVFGEAYGGKIQGMRNTYGPDMKFVAFDVKIEDTWLAVPAAHDVANKLGLDFVDYVKISTNLEEINAQRDADSIQALRNGMGPGKIREGIVLRPPIELTKNNGKRIIVKHKRDEFMETSTPREVDPEKLAVLEEANSIAEEWVTDQRLRHVLDKLPPNLAMENVKEVIHAMVEDVVREAEGEIVDSKEARRAIGKRTAKLFKKSLQNTMEAKVSSGE